MDIGLVCDRCDACNPMASEVCKTCGSALSLQVSGALKAPDGAWPKRGSDDYGGDNDRAAGAKARGPAEPRRDESDYEEHFTRPGGSGLTCPKCRSPIQAGFRFCGACGETVETPKTGRRTATPERRTMFFGAMQQARAKLVLIKGDGLDGISYTLAGEDHIAGRTEGPLLFGDDPFLSPKHANFYYKDSKLHVQELGAANGVYIRIRAPTPVKSGSHFLVGEQLMRVETTPPEDAGLGPDKTGTYFYASPRRASRLCLIQLLRGGDIGLIHRANKDVVMLGREGNDVNFPDDPFISGKHAKIAFQDGGLMLTDTGSRNGTFLRVDGQAPLEHGDYVFMGQQLLRVEIV